jgi:calcineurin-like phosphoesterase family protein
MPGIWFTGDTHFGHAKVAGIRGFVDTTTHDNSISNKWTRQVGNDDVVYVLGDISSGSTTGELHALTILANLPGRKRLITGNHDSVAGIHRRLSPRLTQFRAVFESINDYGRVRVANGVDVLLSHYPYADSGDGPDRGPMRYSTYRLPNEGARLIHAHTHHTHPTNGSHTGLELCVSWDAWRRLVNLGDITKWLDTTKEQ